ncbi:MAG TPA: ABC transporter ATP-binding protein [Candidatus Binatia bacterium]|nr:ABC transporter ATP-binding protein [Candidatus Binatia bacterium]
MLRVDGLHVYYDAIHALQGVSFRVDKGEMVTLLGANGAGKSTTLKTISALLRAKNGTIELEGERLNALPAHEIVRRGIAHVPEGRRVFPRLSVLENLQTGAYSQSGGASADDLERVFGLFPRLKERIRQKAGTLSGGEQQMLAIGRGLMARPKMLLLDEPSMGLAPILVEQIFAIVQAINKEGVTVLLVEQNAAMALAICHRGYVLETGKIILEGTAAELSGNDRVREAYLGG